MKNEGGMEKMSQDERHLENWKSPICGDYGGEGDNGTKHFVLFIYFFKKTIFIEKAGLLRKGETDPKTE